MRQIFLSHKFFRRRLDLFVYLLFFSSGFFHAKAERRKKGKEEKNSFLDLHKEPYQATNEQQKNSFIKT